MEERTVKVELEIKVTQEDVDDIMSGALDGGITYWRSKAKVVGEYLGEYASEQISRGGKLTIYDCEGEAVYTLDLKKLLKGIKLWAEGQIDSSCLERTIGGEFFRINCCNVDAAECDAIIQYALFGEILYS